MKITIQVKIEPDDLSLNAGQFNREMVKLASRLHIEFMNKAIDLYKENKESIDLESLPKHALPRWQ